MEEKMGVRLDQRLVEMGLAETRTKAVWMIEQGYIKVNGDIIIQKSLKVSLNDLIELQTNKRFYVSQGGYKLEKALQHFKIDITGFSVLDIGASTGGFTDCALQHGAKKVVAIDIGEGQLHHSLQNHPLVTSLEKADIRSISPDQLPVKEFDLIVVDISFMSLGLVFPHLHKFQKKDTIIMALLKPQFEQKERRRYKNGIIKTEKVRMEAILKVEEHIVQNGYIIKGMVPTDADGKEKNIEYFLLLSPE